MQFYGFWRKQYFYNIGQQMREFKLKQKCKDVSVYKTMLKEVTSINIRRSSKFNTLAIYGALKCLENVKYPKDLSVYIVTKYGPVTSVVHALKKHKNSEQTSPFDFLNMQGNNASFYVAKALNVEGKNMVLTTKNHSLVEGLEFAKFDMKLGDTKKALVGLVDESVDGILGLNSLDISHWVYLDTL